MRISLGLILFVLVTTALIAANALTVIAPFGARKHW